MISQVTSIVPFDLPDFKEYFKAKTGIPFFPIHVSIHLHLCFDKKEVKIYPQIIEYINDNKGNPTNDKLFAK